MAFLQPDKRQSTTAPGVDMRERIARNLQALRNQHGLSLLDLSARPESAIGLCRR